MSQVQPFIAAGQSDEIEAVVRRFEAAWLVGERLPIDDLLASSDAAREPLLPELVHAELELRLKSGEPARVEEYLERYPALAGAAGVLHELLVAEAQLRRRMGERVTAAEFRHRFPQIASELSPSLWQHGDSAAADGIDSRCPACGGSLAPSGDICELARCESCGHETSTGALGSVDTQHSGQLFGRFELVRQVGRGTFAAVWEARDAKLGRTVALKIPHGWLRTSAALARFYREGRILARLRHPGIVPVFDFGDHQGTPYLVSELVAGATLADYLRSDRLTAREAVELTAKLADAVGYAHREGVLHRDMKPSNILLADHHTPKVADFGLSRSTDDSQDLTGTGESLGTACYMAPEQARGNATPSSDVYALGAILYELLAGRPPFLGDSAIEVLTLAQQHDPPSLRVARPALSPDLEAVCLKCLEKHPERRYANAAELADDLRRFLAGKATFARPLRTSERILRWVAKRPVLAALSATLALALVALVASSLWYSNRLASALDTAKQGRAEAERQRQTAEHHEARAAEMLYAAQIRLAFDDLGRGEIQRAKQVLKDYADGTPHESLRSFPWHHLQRRLHEVTWQTTCGHGEAYALAMAQDGQTLFTGGKDGTLRIWQTEGARPLRTIAAHDQCINSLSLSPDGRVLASASCDRTVRLWDAETHELLKTWGPLAANANHVCFSPDGETLAIGLGVSTIVLFGLEDDASERSIELPPSTGGVTALAWASDSSRLFAGLNQQPNLYVIDSRTFDWEQHAVPEQISGIAIPLDLSRCLLVGRQGRVWVADLQSRQLGLRALDASYHPARIWIAPDNRWAFAAADGSIRAWSGSSFDRRQTIVTDSRSRAEIAVSQDQRMLATASYDDRLRVVRLTDVNLHPALTFSLVPEDGRPLRELIEFDPGLTRMIVRTHPRAVVIWNLQTGQEAERFELNEGTADGVSVATDSAVLFSRKIGEPQAQIWRTMDGAWRSQPWPNPIDVDTLFASTASGRQACVYTARSISIAKEFERPAEGRPIPLRLDFPEGVWSPMVVLAPTGRRVAWLGAKSSAQLTDVVSERSVSLEGGGEAYADLRFSPNDRYLVGCYLAQATVWDAISGRRLQVVPSRRELMSVAVSPDGRTLATGSVDGAVSLWDIPTGQSLCEYPLGSEPGIAVARLCFSADGVSLAATLFDRNRNQGELYLLKGDSEN